MASNPVSLNVNNLLKGQNVAYNNVLDIVQLTKLLDAPIRRRPSDILICRPDSNKTLSDYVVELNFGNKARCAITKFIDPLNAIIMDSDQYIELFNSRRCADTILKYEYPVRVGGRICFMPVLFRVFQLSGKLVKFSISDAENLNKIGSAIWDLARLMINNDVKDVKVIEAFNQTIAKTGVLAKAINIENPLAADVSLEEYVEIFKSIPETAVIISTSNDDYFAPHNFDPKIAELLNVKIDINLKLNEEFMKQLDNIIECVQVMGMNNTKPLGDNLGDASQQSTSKDALPAKKVISLELPSLSLTFKYTENIDVHPSFLFNKLTREKFNEAYNGSKLRIKEIIPLINVKKAGVTTLDKNYLDKTADIPIEDVNEFIETVGKLKGEELLNGIINYLNMENVKVNGVDRYLMHAIEYVLGSMIKTVLKDKTRTPKTRIRNNFINILYWAFQESRVAVEKLGCLDFYSKDEMLYLLNKSCESLFFSNEQAKKMEVFTEKKIIKSKPVINIALGEKQAELVSAATAKTVVSRISVDKSIMSANNVGTSSKVPASNTSGESGYRSVSTGDSFSRTSSYGDNCIKGEKSTKYNPVIPSPDIAQNVIVATVRLVTTNHNNVYYEDFQMKFCTWLSNPQVVRNQAKTVCKYDSYPRFYPERVEVKKTRAVLTEARPSDVMPLEVLDPVLQGNTPNVRTFSSMLMGVLRTTRAVAEKLTPSLLDHRERYNNTSLYCVGSIIMLMLADMEEEGFNPTFGEIPEGSFVTIEFNCENNQSNEVADATIRAMAEKRIFLNAKDLTAKDMQCAKLISAGPSAVRTNADCVQNHIGSSIEIVKCVRWAFYSDEPIHVPNAIGRITSANMQSFLSKVRMQCGDDDAYVSGFIQASCIINGKVHKERYMGFEHSRFYMATLEVVEINLPHSNGHNFLWRVIRLEPARTSNAAFRHDADSLIGTTIPVLNRASVLIASVISLGISTFFNFWNITGFDLNACILPAQNANNLSIIMRELVTAVNGIGAPLFGIACGFINQFSAITINPLVWNNRDWCNGLNSIHSMVYDEEALWEGIWSQHIAYLIDPLAMAFIITSWPDVWGVLAPKVVFELTKEINNLGPQELRMWDAFIGDKLYEEIGKSKEPFRLGNYAIMVISALRQHFDVRQDWPVTMQVYVKAGERFYKVCNTDQYQPEYDRDFNIIKIGTLISYSWHLQRSLIPALTPANIGDALFNVLANAQFMDMTSAGIYLPNTQVGDVLATGIHTTISIQGLGIYQLDRPGSGSARSEN